MSKLLLKTGIYGTFEMNVLSFNSPIFGTIVPVQTKTIAQYFPIKANQPEIQFDVIFRNEREYERFQRFVRATQQFALTAQAPQITLSWPERNIINWTGVIKHLRAGGMRMNYTPRAVFVVDLVDSLVSQRTSFSSMAAPFAAVIGTTLNYLQSAFLQPAAQNLGNTMVSSYNAARDRTTYEGFLIPSPGTQP